MNEYNISVLGKIFTAVESGGQVYGQGAWDDVTPPHFRNVGESTFDGGDIAFGLAASSSGTTSIFDFRIPSDMSKQDLANGKKIIKILGVDECVARKPMYDIALCEMVLNLKTYYDNGVRYIWIPRTINETVTVNTHSVTPVNTIAKPIGYFIYEN